MTKGLTLCLLPEVFVVSSHDRLCQITNKRREQSLSPGSQPCGSGGSFGKLSDWHPWPPFTPGRERRHWNNRSSLTFLNISAREGGTNGIGLTSLTLEIPPLCSTPHYTLGAFRSSKWDFTTVAQFNQEYTVIFGVKSLLLFVYFLSSITETFRSLVDFITKKFTLSKIFRKGYYLYSRLMTWEE